MKRITLIGIIIITIIFILITSLGVVTIKNNYKPMQQQLSTGENGFVTTSNHLSQMQEVETQLSDFKSKIATAITAKGVETEENATAETMVENIEKIKTDESSTILEKVKTKYLMKFKYETNYSSLNGYRAIFDNSNQMFSSITITFKRSTTYGYLKLDYSNDYITGWTDQANSNFNAIETYKDTDTHTIKIDMIGHNYLNIADAHTGTIPTITIDDIEFNLT